MSQYTTGEIAKLCNVSVRTVQYYDTRGILVPSTLSEGGRRLYSEEDRSRLKVICFLREMDIPIDSIKQLMDEAEPEKVIALLLEEQEKRLAEEVRERQGRLDRLGELKQHLKQVEHFSVKSIGDAAYVMENRKKMRRVYRNMLLVGIPIDILEVGAIALWIVKGIWLPFALWLLLDVVVLVWIVPYYLNRVAYICPQCHTIFKANKWEAFWAKHTVSTRKLTCPACGRYGFCVETYGGQMEDKSAEGGCGEQR